MSGLDVGAAVRLALLTGIGGLLLAIVGAVVAASSGSATTGVLARAVLVTGLLLAASRVCLSGRPAATIVPTALAGLLVGYVLTLGWFDGQVYAARLVLDQAAVAVLVDLVLWLAVGLVAATRLARPAPEVGSGYT